MSEQQLHEAVKFSEPTREQAEHLLRELPDFGDRLEVSWWDKGPGIIRHSVYSLCVLRNLMRGMLRLSVEQASLVVWLRDRIGDAELASAVAAVPAEGRSDEAKGAILELVDARVTQCEAVLAPPSADAEVPEGNA